ncbi:PREDICTED: uncharacterized protein LOC109585325 [Amphimedon queenslandica]|uniref:G-protein coupled receptors family 3 profile domain-containing protein n=1 Tax=Amphimedon queenslandica TaxID=400682 RepID=A0A1X7TZ45_AMPQE|nr:PREDICTED: uncharacterized protein LOC109585325 [Amphimedon queenslandica]|eukprot:XP_019856898.1 PREDICTED: uncharacterized protein LOC109585325 [Amphimedon queenslandica]
MSFFSLSLLFLIVSLSFSGAHLHVINVTEENELEQFLCYNDPPVVGDTLVVLYTNITHYISGNVSFCMINTTYSLNITSNSSGPATINCNQTGNHLPWPTTGFSFINVRNLTLQRLVFSGCGGFLKNSSIIDVINSTDYPFHFTQYQSAVLLFPHINILLIEDVNITFYYGFAILTINPVNATINSIEVSGAYAASFYNHSIGSGILLYITDTSKAKRAVPLHITIRNTVLIFNSEYISTVDCLHDFPQTASKEFPVINAAGLTILYSQLSFPCNVSILSSYFITNNGTTGGAILILYYKTNNVITTIKNTKFSDSTIHKNNCEAYGASLALVTLNLTGQNNSLIVENSNFTNSGRYYTGSSGAVFIGVYRPVSASRITVFFSKTIFHGNNIMTTGSCLYAKVFFNDRVQLEVLSIILKNVKANKNFQTSILSINSRAGLFTIVNAHELNITGMNSFHDNYGSVFEITNTRINLNGTIDFVNNKGERGSAFQLHDNSHFHFANGLRLRFNNNTALTKGGAIYSYDHLTDECLFKTQESIPVNIRVTFINNSASESGSSIYANNLYKCIAAGEFRKTAQSLSLYSTIFKFISNSTLNNMSTPANEIRVCNASNIKQVFPGQAIKLYLSASYKDNDQNVVQRAVVSFAIGEFNEKKHAFKSLPSWEVSPKDINQVLLENQNCTLTTISFLKTGTGPVPPNSHLLIVSTMYDSFSKIIDLKLFNCPIGFDLKPAGICDCSKIWDKINVTPNCNINPKNSSLPTIEVQGMQWLGLMELPNKGTVIGVASTCFLYCRRRKSSTVLVVNSTNVAIQDHNNTLSLCIGNREGPLCSQCPPGYSAVFGSYECKQCSNWWLFTLITYAVSGPILIYLLYVLKLTLTTGSLNGIIFCGQLFAVIDVPPSNYSYSNAILDCFLLIKFPFKVCLYNGMTEIGKLGISMLYPVYIILLVLILILLSRYSVRLSNRISDSSVQVLVTVVHLSFSKLLIIIMSVFTPINIYTNTTEVRRVWFRDATVEYGTHGHLVLMIITSLVVGPILGVYMTVLLAGRPLMRINYKIREYIRPVYEAIHAPYKRNKEFFFVSRLLIVLFIYFLYDTVRGRDFFLGFAIAVPILTTYTALEGLCRPFKKMSLNIFNFVLLSVTSVVYGSSWYFIKKGQDQGVIILMTILNLVTTGSLIGITVARLPWVNTLLKNIINKIKNCWFCQSQQKQEEFSHMSGSFFEPYDRVREPLLSSQHIQYH